MQTRTPASNKNSFLRQNPHFPFTRISPQKHYNKNVYYNNENKILTISLTKENYFVTWSFVRRL